MALHLHLHWHQTFPKGPTVWELKAVPGTTLFPWCKVNFPWYYPGKSTSHGNRGLTVATYVKHKNKTITFIYSLQLNHEFVLWTLLTTTILQDLIFKWRKRNWKHIINQYRFPPRPSWGANTPQFPLPCNEFILERSTARRTASQPVKFGSSECTAWAHSDQGRRIKTVRVSLDCNMAWCMALYYYYCYYYYYYYYYNSYF